MTKTNNIRYVGYLNGQYYATTHEWRDFASVMRDTPAQLLWLGNFRWYYTEDRRPVLDGLQREFNIRQLGIGEYMAVDYPLPKTWLAR